MSTDAFSDRPIPGLIDEYAGAAVRQRAAIRIGDYEMANEAYSVLAGVIREVRDRGPAAIVALLALLDDDRVEVRRWVAAHALEFDPKRAESTLETFANGDPNPDQFNAEMVLREWRSGRLTFP